MRRIVLGGALLLAGCQSVVGPRERYCRGVPPIDDPRLTIAEQEKRSRANVALPDDRWAAGPQTWTEGPAYRDRWQH
jgi:hypothetical protein